MCSARVDAHPEIAQRLDAVVEQYPSLGTLRSKLGPGDHLTPAFLQAYVHSKVSGVTRERLLMAALGDLSDRTERPELTAEIARRTLLFLAHHPCEPLSPWSANFKREHLPQRLRRMYAAPSTPGARAKDHRPRLDAYQFVRLALVGPAVELTLAVPPRASEHLRFDDPQFAEQLRRLLPAFVLTESDARRLLTEPSSRHAFTHYFTTGHAVLDLRNALLFYLALLERTDFEASATRKTSRRIDLALLGLPRRGSHPLIALTTQLIALGVLGLLEPGQGAWRDAHLGAAMQALQGAAHAFDIEDIARRHLGHWILDAASIERWHTALAVEGPNARYTRSILFDPQFVLDNAALRDVRRTLAGHYGHIDSPALRAHLLAHYGDRDRDFAEQLSHWFERAPELFNGVRSRALANALYYANFLEERGADPRVHLPAAAKVALGAVRDTTVRPPSSRTPSGQRRPARPRAERRTELPLLDQLTRRRRSTPVAPESRPAPAKTAGRGTAGARKRPAPKRPPKPDRRLSEMSEALGRIRMSRGLAPTSRRGR